MRPHRAIRSTGRTSARHATETARGIARGVLLASLLATLPSGWNSAWPGASTGAFSGRASQGIPTASELQSVDPVLAPAPRHLEFFGFALVDCGFDDPTDGVQKTNYLDEVAGFTNAAHICPFDPTEVLAARLDAMVAQGVRGVLSLDAILFETFVDTTRPSGLRTSLRPDFAARWASFLAANGSHLDQTHLRCISLVDEPTWNGVPPSELEQAADLVAATIAGVPLLVIEAGPAVIDLIVPEVVDWLAFDHYGVLDPRIDPLWQDTLAELAAKRTRPEQRLVIIAEAQWIPLYAPYAVTPSTMGDVFLAYYDLCASDPRVIGMLAYLWPGGFDDPDQLGARQLPDGARGKIRAVGRAVLEGQATPRSPIRPRASVAPEPAQRAR